MQLQEFKRCCVLNALGHDRQSEVVRERNRGLHDDRVFRIVQDPRDERAVHLQAFERQAAQVRERTKADAVVINYDGETLCAAVRKNLSGAISIVDERGFRDF